MYSDIEYLEEFVYDSKLKELKVFSKQYFNSIIYSMYKSNPDKLVCFTFGDFNKLGQINKKFSSQAGDTALKTSLALIKAGIPENSIIARIAGDEFCFITPDTDKNSMDKTFKQIDKTLKDNSENIYGLSITTSSIDSTLYPNFEDMYIHTELDVCKQKKSNNKNANNTLENAIYTGLSNYFSYYRLETNSLPKEYYSILKNGIIDVVIHNLEHPDSNLLFLQQSLSNTSSELDFEQKHFEIPPEIAFQIHNYITTKTNEQISENTEFNKLFEFLITDPLTGQFSKKFFDSAVLPLFEKNTDRNISIRLFDLAHLKLSNDIVGHNKTDENIHDLFKKLVQQIQDTNSSSKYLASAGNCGLLLIENSDSAIPENQINTFINNAMINQKILNVVTSNRICKSNQICETIDLLNQDCKQKKEKQKLDKINSSETVWPLQLALNDSINYYLKTSSNPFSIKNKQEFVVKIFETLSKVIREQFPEQSPTDLLDKD